MAEIDELFAYLTTLGVDGFIISPAYSYAAVNSKEIFMTRDDIKAKFRRRGDVPEVPLPLLARLPGIPPGQARDAVHRLGQPDPQHQGLEGPLLPDHRHPPRHLRTS